MRKVTFVNPPNPTTRAGTDLIANDIKVKVSLCKSSPSSFFFFLLFLPSYRLPLQTPCLPQPLTHSRREPTSWYSAGPGRRSVSPSPWSSTADPNGPLPGTTLFNYSLPRDDQLAGRGCYTWGRERERKLLVNNTHVSQGLQTTHNRSVLILDSRTLCLWVHLVVMY